MANFILKVVCVFFWLSFFSGVVSAQDFNQTLDDKYTPPEGSVFHSDAKTENGKSSNKNYSNILALNLTTPLRGAVILQYQRKLTENLAIEVGGGVSVLPPSIYITRQVFYTSSNNNLVDFANGDYSMTPQLCFTGAFLYYPDRALDGSYIGLEYRRFNYEMDYSSAYRSASPFGASINAFTAINDIQVKYGGTLGDNDLVSQFYIGTGMRFGYEEYPEEDYSFWTVSSATYYSLEQTTIIQFLMTLGVTLGPRF